MNTLTKSLLSGAALSALISAPAMSQQNYRPSISVTALHAGRAVNKTQRYYCLDQHHTTYGCTFTVFTYAPPSDYNKKILLLGTFYKLNDNGDLCSNPRQHIVARKKSKYGEVDTGSITYYEGCPGQQPTFYGDYYTLTKKKGFGKWDYFESNLRGTFHDNGKKYKGQVLLGVAVIIDDKKTAEHSN